MSELVEMFPDIIHPEFSASYSENFFCRALRNDFRHSNSKLDGPNVTLPRAIPAIEQAGRQQLGLRAGAPRCSC